MARKDVSDEMVCRAVKFYKDEMEKSDYRANVPYPYEILSEVTGEPEKVCYRAMERAYDHGLIECGVSLRTGWLTRKGESILAQGKI